MRILLVTPLYPPEISEQALCVKTLAGRLTGTATVRVLLYGHLPEHVEGVECVCVDKSRPRPVRLFAFTRALLREARRADVVIVENGPSTELPMLIVSFLCATPFILHAADTHAAAHTKSSYILSLVHRSLTRRARAVLTTSPLPRPEILPLASFPDEAMARYEHSWQTFLHTLTPILYE